MYLEGFTLGQLSKLTKKSPVSLVAGHKKKEKKYINDTKRRERSFLLFLCLLGFDVRYFCFVVAAAVFILLLCGWLGLGLMIEFRLESKLGKMLAMQSDGFNLYVLLFFAKLMIVDGIWIIDGKSDL